MHELSLSRWRWLMMNIVVFAYWLALAAPVHAKSDRYVFVISDTHFGVGRDKTGAWDAYEDARWPGDLATFLKYAGVTGAGKADLVINGDVFELWQSRDIPCVYSSKDAGCSDADALLRFKKVVTAHAEEINLLKAFASTADNKLTLVVGNHDVALLLPSVKAELLRTFACPECKVSFQDTGVWQSDDGKVRAFLECWNEGAMIEIVKEWPEIGKQIEDKLNTAKHRLSELGGWVLIDTQSVILNNPKIV